MLNLNILPLLWAFVISAPIIAQSFDGYFDFTWDKEQGKIWLSIEEKIDQEFLYVNSLSSGVGSNDLGLDRNQLGQDRIVKFVRSGPKILLVQPNYEYRAISENPEERLAVEQAFAKSVIWGFKEEIKEGKKWIDLTPFLLRDAHGVAQRLQSSDQGTYKVDGKRSAVYLPRTKNFPKNTEFDAMITLTGTPKGRWIRSVTPSASAVTVHMHHSFIELPDDGYKPRLYDPRSGLINISFYDYATPIDQPLEKRYITRHRLEKKDPNARISEAVEPIIYYIDRGCPEPIKSALIEGALWWDHAFRAGGYKNAFQVKELPPEADPMDVRYNMINWVHRSTRGWSYGSSIVDPRTGEILKGHVLLGSLRVRQDYLIAQGLMSLFKKGDESTDPMIQMALARLRQLSAHEVGHTIGMRHNFAASVNDRASVMDYPHPYITLGPDDQLNFENAYDIGIGEWDKRTVLYAYQDFAEGTDESIALQGIIRESNEMGLHYISDQDARPTGGAHPAAHLWDNGGDALAELQRLMEVRADALGRFGVNTIPEGEAMATLEKVLVPLYLSHRYQVEAVAKSIGGVSYTYSLRGDGQLVTAPVAPERQEAAFQLLLETLDPAFLALDEQIIRAIPPQPAGYDRHRELFQTYTGITFDPLAAAESSIAHTLQFLLHPQRLTRIIEQSARNKEYPGLADYLEKIRIFCSSVTGSNGLEMEIRRMLEKQYLRQLLALQSMNQVHGQVVANAQFAAAQFVQNLRDASKDLEEKAHQDYLMQLLARFAINPGEFKLPEMKAMPPGSPIGCGHE